MRVPTWPIKKDHVKVFDKNKQNMFTRAHGARAAEMDKKLGVDYDVYHALNMQAQRATLKCLEKSREIN